MSNILTCFRLFLAAVIVTAALPQSAAAYNVPGSAQSRVPEVTEIATGIIVRSLKNSARSLRDQDVGVTVSTRGTLGTTSTMGLDGMPLAFSLDHRLLNTPRFVGSLSVGTLFLGGQADNGFAFFGGLVGETGTVRTPLDNGRIRHLGAGAAIGFDYELTNQLYLTAIAGVMAMSYDVSRGGGVVTGSYNATRQFLDLSADYSTRALGGDLTVGAGLLYVSQSNQGYTESGGAVIAPYRFDQLALTLDARNTWGQPGGFRPYADLSAQFRLAGNDIGAGLAVPVHATRQARVGVGIERAFGASFFDLGLGANFENTTYSGLDARLSYTFRF